MDKQIKIKELVLNDDGEWMGLYANSIVSAPAIERTAVLMKKHKPKAVSMTTEQGERRMMYGPVMIPDLMIYRRDDQTQEEWYATYSAETVRKCMNMFMKKGLQSRITIEHAFPITGVTMVENWIVEDSEKDKSVALGLEPLAVGTWMTGALIEDDDTWELAKNGALTGFSIEAFFDQIEKHGTKTEEERFIEELETYMKSFQQ